MVGDQTKAQTKLQSINQPKLALTAGFQNFLIILTSMVLDKDLSTTSYHQGTNHSPCARALPITVVTWSLPCQCVEALSWISMLPHSSIPTNTISMLVLVTTHLGLIFKGTLEVKVQLVSCRYHVYLNWYFIRYQENHLSPLRIITFKKPYTCFYTWGLHLLIAFGCIFFPKTLFMNLLS